MKNTAITHGIPSQPPKSRLRTILNRIIQNSVGKDRLNCPPGTWMEDNCPKLMHTCVSYENKFDPRPMQFSQVKSWMPNRMFGFCQVRPGQFSREFENQREIMFHVSGLEIPGFYMFMPTEFDSVATIDAKSFRHERDKENPRTDPTTGRVFYPYKQCYQPCTGELISVEYWADTVKNSMKIGRWTPGGYYQRFCWIRTWLINALELASMWPVFTVVCLNENEEPEYIVKTDVPDIVESTMSALMPYVNGDFQQLIVIEQSTENHLTLSEIARMHPVKLAIEMCNKAVTDESITAEDFQRFLETNQFSRSGVTFSQVKQEQSNA